MLKSNSLKNTIIISSIVIIAGLGTLFTAIGQNWFSTLFRPTQWVPSFVFGVVLTIIYSIFAVVLINWTKKQAVPKSTLVLLVLNGLFNVLWCLVFFTLKQTLLGNIVILINSILAILLFIDICGKNKVYAYITAIYPLWILIATTLNTAIWILN